MNPFHLTYNRLMEMAKKDKTLSKYIRDGNFVQLDKTGVQKKSATTSDFPELLLTSTGITGNYTADSSTTEIEYTFNFILTTNSFNLVEKVSELEWGLLCALSRWCIDLTALTWNGSSFINRLQLGGITTDLIAQDEQRSTGLEGFSVNWPFLVYMQFNTLELRNNQWVDSQENMLR